MQTTASRRSIKQEALARKRTRRHILSLLRRMYGGRRYTPQVHGRSPLSLRR